jgi:hypothetical protein
VPNGDVSSQKKVSDLTLTEVADQMQMLEYIATNTPQGLTDADRRFRQELEEHEKLLARDRSRDPKLEDDVAIATVKAKLPWLIETKRL